MKRLFILTVCMSFILLGCASTSNIPSTPSEINYTEITGKEYCDKAGSWSSYSANDKLTSLFLASKGYKVKDVFITGATKVTENGKDEFLFELRGDSYGDTVRVYATDFVINKKETDPSFAERIDAVNNNKKYNGKYTFYIYGNLEGNAFFGYTAKAILYDIEGIPTQEQIDARQEEESRLRGNSEKVYEVPKKLTKKLEKEIYKNLVTELKATDILNDLDIELLIQTVTCIIKMDEAKKLMDKNGLVIYDDNGGAKTNPACKLYKDFTDMYYRCSSQLGLSPSARAKLASINIQTKEAQDDELIKALRG